MKTHGSLLDAFLLGVDFASAFSPDKSGDELGALASSKIKLRESFKWVCYAA